MCLCVWVYVYISLYVDVCISIHLHLEHRDHPQASWPRNPPLGFWSKGLPLAQKLSGRIAWMASNPRDSPVFAFQVPRFQTNISTLSFFLQVLGIELRSSSIHNKPLSPESQKSAILTVNGLQRQRSFTKPLEVA